MVLSHLLRNIPPFSLQISYQMRDRCWPENRGVSSDYHRRCFAGLQGPAHVTYRSFGTRDKWELQTFSPEPFVEGMDYVCLAFLPQKLGRRNTEIGR